MASLFPIPRFSNLIKGHNGSLGALTGECPHHATQELFSSIMDFIIYIYLIFFIFSPSVQARKLKLDEFYSTFFEIKMSF